MLARSTWKKLVYDVVLTLPRNFVLGDVLKHQQEFERHFPGNHFVDAKIRQSLQILRDQGLLRFTRPGHYERLDKTPLFSPLIDFTVASQFISPAQAARVALRPGRRSTFTAYAAIAMNSSSSR